MSYHEQIRSMPVAFEPERYVRVTPERAKQTWEKCFNQQKTWNVHPGARRKRKKIEYMRTLRRNISVAKEALNWFDKANPATVNRVRRHMVATMLDRMQRVEANLRRNREKKHERSAHSTPTA